MVKIVKLDSNGAISRQLTVALGAFNEMFRHQGWQLASEVVKTKKPEADETNEEEANHEVGGEEIPDETDDSSEDGESDEGSEEDGETDEDLMEKPLTEMSGPELKRYAELNGIDVSDCNGKRAARDKIKAAMKAKADKE